MNGTQLKGARLAASYTQQEAARKLGVTQPYLSMLECGSRAVSTAITLKAVELFPVPATALSFRDGEQRQWDYSYFAAALGTLGYSGFAHRRDVARVNPAELLLEALDRANLDARITEGLPWLLVTYPQMDWDWLTRNAKLRDRQNRLAFSAALAAQVAEKRGDAGLASFLAEKVNILEPSRLVAEGTLCRESMTQTERTWLRTHRSPLAAHWNLLTDLSIGDLDHALQ